MFNSDNVVRSRINTKKHSPFGTLCARLPDNVPAGKSRTGGAARALQLFCQHVLQHRLIQGQFCHQALQSYILFLHLSQLTSLVHFRPTNVSSSDKTSAPRSPPGESTPPREPQPRSASGWPRSAPPNSASVSRQIPLLGSSICRKLVLRLKIPGPLSCS
jgi:hypothetical protein